jgi:putative Mg2+ transporter-C (MgtC) family protein
MDAIPELSWFEVLVRLGVAAGLGGLIGIERELRERGAGLRTHLLVAVGSALFTLVSAYGFREFLIEGGLLVRLDPTRIAAQIVTGIGFLGAGAILRQGLFVRGLTTAASLWVVAAIGMAAGAGYYTAAVFATAFALLGLWPLRIWAYRLLRQARHDLSPHLSVELSRTAGAAAVVATLASLGVRVRVLESTRVRKGERLELTLDLPRGLSAAAVAAAVGGVDDVTTVHWGGE